MHRRVLLAGAVAVPLVVSMARAADLPRVAVAKSPTCGCCGTWVEHMRAAGFDVEVKEVSDDALAALKRRLGLAPQHASCHTGQVEGYFIEGHVPAEDVERLLAERPDALGLAVPGMPIGSPGMEMGSTREPYDTLLIGANGEASVFARH
jgi:hypothetical protein